MRKRKFIISAALSALTLLGSGGLTAGASDEPEPICGGVTDRTDHSAPKKIESKEISGFEVSFALYDEESPRGEIKKYNFEIKPDDNGVLTAFETIAFEKAPKRSAPADEKLLTELQHVIDEEKLANQNGVYRITAGLPPEYQECWLKVNYASGEKLKFNVNNDPDANWAKNFHLVFADWFKYNSNDSLIHTN